MDPIRIAVRVVAAYLFLLVLLRVSGRRTLHQSTSFDFVLALILGDMIDDALWAEVPFSQFVVATGTLVITKLVSTAYKLPGIGVRREITVAATMAAALGIVALAVFGGGDRRTLVSPPDAVAEELVRALEADRPAQTRPALSRHARETYSPKRLAMWFREVKARTERIRTIEGENSTIDDRSAEAIVVVEGSSRTLRLPIGLVLEDGLWRIDSLPDALL